MFPGGLQNAQPPVEQPSGFAKALEDVLTFFGGIDTSNTPPPEADPYQPRQSANIMDRRDEAPEVDPATAYQRFADDPKRAAARISLLPRGVVPMGAALYDYYGGNNPKNLNLSGLYRKRQLEADIVQGQQSATSQAVQQLAPFVLGGLTGAVRPAQTVMGTVGRGALAGGAYKGTEGYFAPSVDGEDLDSPARIGSGLAGFGIGAISGGATAGLAKMGRDQVTDTLAARAQSKATESQARTDRQTRLEESRAAKRTPIKYSPEEEAKLADLYEARYSKATGKTTPDVIAARKEYQQNRSGFIRSHVDAGLDVEQIAKGLNTSPAQIARYINVNMPIPKSGRYQQVIQDVVRITEGERLAKARRTPPPRPSAPAQPQAPANPSQPQGGLSAAPQAPEAPKAAPSKTRVPKEPVTQMELRRFNASPAGKRSWQEIQANTRRAQLDADAQAIKSTYNPPSIRESTGVPKGKLNTARDSLNIQRRENRPEGYKPTAKRGVMQIADDVSANSGRSPTKWTREDQEAFVSRAARHTSLSPAKIKGMLAQYDEGKSSARRGISSKRVRELIEAERNKKK